MIVSKETIRKLISFALLFEVFLFFVPWTIVFIVRLVSVPNSEFLRELKSISLLALIIYGFCAILLIIRFFLVKKWRNETTEDRTSPPLKNIDDDKSKDLNHKKLISFGLLFASSFFAIGGTISILTTVLFMIPDEDVSTQGPGFALVLLLVYIFCGAGFYLRSKLNKKWGITNGKQY
ncbi:hypothetical protein LC087_10825 [Bacillus carboniphilus]|uniref:Uncharacterized protein n=1 Tax=Bacillus carboniphilus TaxID=86663 RepID=A0ABY9JUQ0_9BACI|nr:hypothetical protein [Bacillus carboniphilus]WLR41401.1 hypothetical protein LC087_10825 [Bacillus carboniphilus]